MTKGFSTALIGAGSMGGALLRGWIEQGAIDPKRSAVFDPKVRDDIAQLCNAHGVVLNPSVDSADFDAVILAIKPQVAAEVLPQYAGLAVNAPVVSVMAGKDLKSIAEALDGANKVARAMPNLPAAIGQGVTGVYAPSSFAANEREMIEALMKAAGDVVWVDSEEGVDFVTAISGSGPAYFFLLTEALAEAGAEIGLDPEAAALLARATFTGTGALMKSETRSPAEMRDAVTSPGGTTAAALSVFDGDDRALRQLVKNAVRAAAKRAGELTG